MPRSLSDKRIERSAGVSRAPEETADAMVANGMKDAGYQYVTMDDCWMAGQEQARAQGADQPGATVGARAATDAEDDARVATGLVYFPDGPAPDDGWPIVAWAHGTSGLAPQCAPSRGPSPPPG